MSVNKMLRIKANVLQDGLPALLENVPIQTRRQIYYQHGRAQPHFSQVVRQYLNHKFPNRWIGRGGTQNWPPRSPDMNALHYHMWGYMKAIVYACGVFPAITSPIESCCVCELVRGTEKQCCRRRKREREREREKERGLQLKAG